MPRILRKHLISMAWILFSSSAFSVHVSHAYKKMASTNERISLILELIGIFLSFKIGPNLLRAAMVRAILAKISGLDPFSDTVAPRYLNLSTYSSLCPLIDISDVKFLVLLTSFKKITMSSHS